MPIHVMTDAYIAIGGTAYSDHANNVVLDDKADQIDVTPFSSAGYKSYIPGLKDGSITVTWFSDFDAGKINSVLQPLYASGGTVGIEIRPTSSAVSSTNPSAKMTARIYAFSGITGKVGASAEFDTVFQNASTAGLVWATA
jgi:hypothetical protein